MARFYCSYFAEFARDNSLQNGPQLRTALLSAKKPISQLCHARACRKDHLKVARYINGSMCLCTSSNTCTRTRARPEREGRGNIYLTPRCILDVLHISSQALHS